MNFIVVVVALLCAVAIATGVMTLVFVHRYDRSDAFKKALTGLSSATLVLAGFTFIALMAHGKLGSASAAEYA